MKLHKYPMDTQVCPMLFESFGYTMDSIYFVWQKLPVEIEKNVQLPQFKLQSVYLYDCVQNYTAGAFPCLEIKFLLRRDFGYFFIQIYVPSMLVVILSWVSFWLNVEASPARVSIGLLTVLTITTQNSGINAALPRVSYIKAVDVWMSVCLIFAFAGLLEYALVNVLSRRRSKVVVKEKKPMLVADVSSHQGVVTKQPSSDIKSYMTNNVATYSLGGNNAAMMQLKTELHESLQAISEKYKMEENRQDSSSSPSESPMHYNTLPLHPPNNFNHNSHQPHRHNTITHQPQHHNTISHLPHHHNSIFHHHQHTIFEAPHHRNTIMHQPHYSPNFSTPSKTPPSKVTLPSSNLVVRLSANKPHSINSTLQSKRKLEPEKGEKKVKLIDGIGHAKEIDKMSRKLFPFIFILFNIIYWLLYALPYIQSAKKIKKQLLST